MFLKACREIRFCVWHNLVPVLSEMHLFVRLAVHMSVCQSCLSHAYLVLCLSDNLSDCLPFSPGWLSHVYLVFCLSDNLSDCLSISYGRLSHVYLVSRLSDNVSDCLPFGHGWLSHVTPGCFVTGAEEVALRERLPFVS